LYDRLGKAYTLVVKKDYISIETGDSKHGKGRMN
jgi:hypothetical protein